MSFTRSRLPNWLSFLLVWALLWTPLWAHWHRIAHSTPQGGSAPIGLHEAHAAEDGQAARESAIGGHAAGSELCLVLDHLAHAERLSASIAAWTAPRVPGQAPVFELVISPDQDLWSPAQARAPPALI